MIFTFKMKNKNQGNLRFSLPSFYLHTPTNFPIIRKTNFQMEKNIIDLIAQNRLFDALKLMQSLQQNRKNKNALALLESRLNGVNKKIRLGLLSEENANIELNKIRNGLLEIHAKAESPTPQKSGLSQQQIMMAAGGLVLLLMLVYFFIPQKSTEPVDILTAKGCEDRKIAVLVADFENKEKETDVDKFANTLVTRMDKLLDDRIYDVAQVGKQTRQIKRYDEVIRAEHFDATCDTSGLFVNGLMDESAKVFNIYITLANLKMKTSNFSDEGSIVMDNPAGIEFSTNQDASFLSDLILAILKSYEGETYNALERFFELEKKYQKDVIENDRDLTATVAHFKGNCYAMRGDNMRAKKEFDTVEKYGNPELQRVAKENSKKADVVNQEMKANPELAAQLNTNRKQHSQFEKDLQKFFRGLEKGLNKFGKKLENAFRKK